MSSTSRSTSRVARVSEFYAHGDTVNCARIGKRSVLVTGGDDCLGKVWKLGRSEPLMTLHGHQTEVDCITFDPLEVRSAAVAPSTLLCSSSSPVCFYKFRPTTTKQAKQC
jgi:WD40 repeat protein